MDKGFLSTYLNFFFLALTLLAVYYYAYRLRIELRRSNRLKSESDRYKELFNATAEGVIEIDKEGRFVIINQGGARLLGYDQPPALLSSGSRFQDFFVEPAEWKRMRNQILESDSNVSRIARIQTFQKGQIWIEMTFHARQYESDGEVHIEGIFRDVTERLSLQEELQSYSEDLKRKIDEKTGELLVLERYKFNLEKLAATGQLVAQLVHELRNPLSSIKMGLTTIQRRAVLKDKDGRIVEISLQEVSRVERMMKELLAFAKPTVLKLSPCRIDEILDLSIQRVGEQLASVNCKVTRKYGKDLPALNLDRERIAQVFTNLMLNAQQASGMNGQLIISTWFDPEAAMLTITIRDFGTGIPPEQLPRIFEPFFSKREGGTGLGLTVVKTIVEAHTGEVSIESQVGEGTTVEIRLPVKPSEEAQTP